MPAIEFEHVDYYYETRNQRFRALEDITLNIGNGEFLCVIGPSGCGKTTLLRLLAGLQLPTAGEIRINGEIVKGPGLDRSIVFQNYTLFPWMSARKNVQFAIRHARRKLQWAEINEYTDDFLNKVDMTDAADKYPCQLSGGMRQRVAIARALAMDADILLLDEPFGALDAKIRGELQALLAKLCYGDGGKRKTVVFVTHDIREALRLADRIIFMRQGKIAVSIPVDLPRPRNALESEDSARMGILRRELMFLFGQENAEMDEGCSGFNCCAL